MNKISVLVVLACIGATGATAFSQAGNAGPGGSRVLVRVPDAGMRFELRGLGEARGVSGREGATGRLARLVPPAPINTEDPADSLYRLARRAMADASYRRAAQLFAELVEKYPRSDYAGDALYYRAYSLFQSGRPSDLDDAIAAIDQQGRSYPKANTREDSQALKTRIEAEQAKRGNAGAAQRIEEKAKQLGEERGCPSEDDDIRISALQGLMQMESESALPILKQVFAKRGSCSESLRKHAVFIASQKQGDEATTLLLEVASTDPSREVRAEAIQWLGQSRSARAVAALDSIASTSTDEEILDKAIFALSQQGDDRATQTLRRVAQDSRKPAHTRTQAVFWLGQTRRDPEDFRFLRDLFGKADDDELRGSIIQALAQSRSAESMRWLLDLARDKSLPLEPRKNSLFWAGQNGVDLRQLIALYDELRGQEEMQNQLIFVYSQRRDSEATEKLMDIATRDPSRELRKQAIFWLGQKKDPRVTKFLLDLINR